LILYCTELLSILVAATYLQFTLEIVEIEGLLYIAEKGPESMWCWHFQSWSQNLRPD